MNSALYVGSVRHRRFKPFFHAFRYRLFMLWLDLDEAPQLFASIKANGNDTESPPRFRLPWLLSDRPFSLLRFRRADHLGPIDRPLADAVRDAVERHTGRRPDGPVRLLTLLRSFGVGFNPLSLYYCYDASGRTVQAVVAEVSNTPWREQHLYVLDAASAPAPPADAPAVHLAPLTPPPLDFTFRKDFHVSPFMPMDQQYRCRLTHPGPTLVVHFENIETGRRVFDATVTLRRRPLSPRSVGATFLSSPFLGFKVLAAIYFQALRLWLKRAPFFPHPSRSRAQSSLPHDPMEVTEQ